MTTSKDLTAGQKKHIVDSLARWLEEDDPQADHSPNKLELYLSLRPNDDVVIEHWSWVDTHLKQPRTVYPMPLQEEEE